MAKREAPIKHLKVRIINIVLYPEDKQRKENYINLWEKIHNDKKTISTFGDRFTRIRTLYKSEDSNVIHGDFSNAVFFGQRI